MNHTLTNYTRVYALNTSSRTVIRLLNNTRKALITLREFHRPIVLHNETFGVLGLRNDVEASLWGTILAASLLACMLCTCFGVLYTSHMRNTNTQTTYESLPLVTIKMGRR